MAKINSVYCRAHWIGLETGIKWENGNGPRIMEKAWRHNIVIALAL